MKLRILTVSLVAALIFSAAQFCSAGYIVFWGIDMAELASANIREEPHYRAKLITVGGKILDDAIAVSTTINFSLAVKENGTVAGWGSNDRGQAVGEVVGTSQFASQLVRVDGHVLTNVVSVRTGAGPGLAVLRDGAVVQWGPRRMNPAKDLKAVSAIAAGHEHVVALLKDGTVTWWGTPTFRGSAAPEGLTGIVAIAVGGDIGQQNDLALRSDGTVIRWGDSHVVPAGLSNVVAISVGEGSFGGEGHCLALRRDGTVVGWGQNTEGQASVPECLTNIVAISAGSRHSLALTRDGRVVAWGSNRQGQLRIPTGLSNVVAIAAGNWSSLAITTNAVVAEMFRSTGP